MDHMNVNQVAYIRVERVHEKIKVVQIIEFPTCFYEGVPEDILQRNGVHVGRGRKVCDPCKLERRGKDFDGWSRVVSTQRRGRYGSCKRAM